MKKYFCDQCEKEVWFLYDLTFPHGVKSLCQECYYANKEIFAKIENLCSGILADCQDCEKC